MYELFKNIEGNCFNHMNIFNNELLTGDLNTISIDIYKDENNYYADLNLAGFKKENIKVSVENKEIVVNATKKEPEEFDYLQEEITYGDIIKKFKVSDKINLEEISSSFVDGILTIKTPINENQKPKEIKIN